MATGDAKIKIKVGEVEIDYEGDAAFLKDGLLAVCQELSKLNEHIPASRTPKLSIGVGLGPPIGVQRGPL